MSKKVSVFLIGAQKAGTTSLSHLLDQHPLISVSNPKEPHFFTRNSKKDLCWYHSLFTGNENSNWLDASPSYAMAPLESYIQKNEPGPLFGIPEKIYKYNPEAKFIYILRNPIARTYSAYWHNIRAGNEKQSFSAAVTKNSVYMRGSYYSHQIKNYLKFFPLDSFYFILFEDFIRDPETTAHACFKFLALKPFDCPVHLSETKNKSYTYKGTGVILSKLVPNHILKKISIIIKKALPNLLLSLIEKNMTQEIPKITKSECKFLTQYFYEKNIDLENLIDLKIDRWK